MKKTTKIFLIIATALVASGMILFTVVMSFNKWDFGRMSTVKYEEATHEIEKDITAIDIDINAGNVEIKKSDDGKIRIFATQPVLERFEACVLDDGTLSVTQRNDRKWYDYIAIGFQGASLTVYLPGEEYGALKIDARTSDVAVDAGFTFGTIDISITTGDVVCNTKSGGDVNIKTTTGDIELKDIWAKNLTVKTTTGGITVDTAICDGDVNITVTTGNCDLSGMRCENFYSTGGSGDLKMNIVRADKKLEIKRTTGGVTLEKCDAGEIEISTTTGNVTGSLASEKIFFTQATTGKIDVPETTIGGTCKITTTTGDITIKISPVPTE